jgi:hypothetical protein
MEIVVLVNPVERKIELFLFIHPTASQAKTEATMGELFQEIITEF